MTNGTGGERFGGCKTHLGEEADNVGFIRHFISTFNRCCLSSADSCLARELLAQMGMQFASVSGSNRNPPEHRIKFELLPAANFVSRNHVAMVIVRV